MADNQQQTIQNLQAEVAQKNNQVTQLTNEKNQLNTQVTQLTNEKNQLNTQKTQLTNEKNQLNTQVTQLTNEKNQLNTQVTQLTNDKNQLNTQNTQLTNEKNQLNAQVTQLTSEKNQLNTQVTQLTNEKNQLNTQVTQLTNEKNQLNTQNTQLTNEKNQLNTQVTQLTNDKTQLNTQVTQLTNEKNQLNTQVTQLTNEKNQLNTQVTQLTNDKNQLNTQNTQLTNEKNQLNTQITQLKQEEVNLNSQITILKNQIKGYKEKKNSLKKQINQQQEINSKQIENYEQEIEDLNSEIQTLSNKVLMYESEKSNGIPGRTIILRELKSKYQQITEFLSKSNMQNGMDNLAEFNQQKAQQFFQLSQEIETLKKQIFNEDQLKEANYNIEFNLNTLFNKNCPKFENLKKLEDLQSDKYFNKNVSFYGKAQGKTFLLNQLVQKQFPGSQTPDIAIYIHEENQEQDICFIDSQSVDQPIPIYQDKNSNSNSKVKGKSKMQQSVDTEGYKIQKMKENLKRDLLVDISDVLIVVVNKITSVEQDMIIKLKNHFINMSDKTLIIVHNLFELTKIEDLVQQAKQIKGYFNLSEKKQDTNKYYFIEKDSQNIVHYILGNQQGEGYDIYFNFPIQSIKDKIFKENQESCPIYEGIKNFLNSSINHYLEIELQQNQNPSDGHSKQQSHSISDEQLSINHEERINKEDKTEQMNNDLSRNQQQQQQQNSNDTPTTYEIYTSRNYASYYHQLNYFIEKEEDLILDETKYKFKNVKNYTHELVRCQTNPIRYQIEEINDGETINVYLEVPGELIDIDAYLLSENKRLIFKAYKLPEGNINNLKENEISYGEISVQLSKSYLQFYKINKLEHVKEGLYKIELLQNPINYHCKILSHKRQN